ncbi:MAG TPA: hypothetical protein DCQ06_09385, partial [Myxococcales bacterium]|nr:hypothetical protein [Myxococcales bacterium]
VKAEVSAALLAWNTAVEQLQRTAAEAKRAKSVEATSYQRWKAGLSNVHTWTSAETMAFRSAVAHQTARYTLLRAGNVLSFVTANRLKSPKP